MRKLIALSSLTVLLILGAAASARGDNPHPPGCKGDPHNCGTATTTDTSTTMATATASAPAAPSVQTVTVNAPAQPAASASGSATVTVIVQPSKVATIVKVKVKKVRRYCTMQRHGWRCAGHPPHPHKR